MTRIKKYIEFSNLSNLNKAILARVAGLLIPILTAVDMTIALLAHAFFLVTGVIRLISGRGPLYTEVTTNPLMHAAFFIQHILKSVGNLIGTFVWFVSPTTGLKISLLPANLFLKLQINMVMFHIKRKMSLAKDKERFVVPLISKREYDSILFYPLALHKTYLIVEKQNEKFLLHLVNRPTVDRWSYEAEEDACNQIRLLLDKRFDFMHDPHQMERLEFSSYGQLASQGNSTNCVVSNLFGTFQTLSENDASGEYGFYKSARESLMKDYGFYQNDFFPFKCESDEYSLKNIWSRIEDHPAAVI